jgi:hypothetical protein
VENFQGEESKIIIVSLVQSNKRKKVGLLKTKNRITVLLSRAQHVRCSSILWLDLEFRLPSCDPHPHIGLKEKARIKRMPRKCRVHDRKFEISKELDTSDDPRKKSLL